MAEFSRKIHGKRVTFIVGRDSEKKLLSGKLTFSEASILGMIKQKAGRINFHYFKEFCRYYYNSDKNGFYGNGKNFVQEIIEQVLKANPDFITSDSFKVHIEYLFDKIDISSGYVAAAYLSYPSSSEEAHFRINLVAIMVIVLSKGINSLIEIINHEFTHHLDINFIKKQGLAIDFLKEKYPLGDVNPNFDLIIRLFGRIRTESITRFYGSYKAHRRIKFYGGAFVELINFLEDACRKFGLNNYSSFSEKIYNSDFPHKLGSMMASVIFLNELSKKNKRDSALIKSGKFLGLSTKEESVGKIWQYYGKKDFEVYFIEDEEVDAIAYDVVKFITKISYVRFLKEYETACNQLGVEPFITFSLYQSYYKKCLKSYRKQVD